MDDCTIRTETLNTEEAWKNAFEGIKEFWSKLSSHKIYSKKGPRIKTPKALARRTITGTGRYKIKVGLNGQSYEQNLDLTKVCQAAAMWGVIDYCDSCLYNFSVVRPRLKTGTGSGMYARGIGGIVEEQCSMGGNLHNDFGRCKRFLHDGNEKSLMQIMDEVF